MSGGDLCLINATLDGERVGLTASSGRITGIGPEVEAEPGATVLDAAGAILVPPLINGTKREVTVRSKVSGVKKAKQSVGDFR